MNIQENITKFTNLELNDSLSAFRGHTAQQSHNAYQVFYDFISEVKPSRILEIGTALGGFTEFLKIITDVSDAASVNFLIHNDVCFRKYGIYYIK